MNHAIGFPLNPPKTRPFPSAARREGRQGLARQVGALVMQSESKTKS